MARKIILLLLALPFASSKGLAQSRIFWADAEHITFRSVYLDGTHVTTVAEVSPMTGMTVDTHHGWIYYIPFPLGHGIYGDLRRLPITGGVEELLVGVDVTEGGLSIDYDAGKIYWATRQGDMTHISIMRSNLDGTELDEVAHEPSVYCKGIAVDPVGRHVYWTTGETILRADVATGVVEDVGPDPQAAPYPNFDGGISIDAQARKMYWTRRGNRSSSGWIGMFRADLDGSNIELLYSDIYADADDILVDGVNKYVYWTQWTSFQPAGIYIRRARIDQPITSENIQNIVGPPDTPDDLTRDLGLFIDPGPAVMESPANETEDVATTTELRWRSVQCSPRYDVQVASDADFAQIVYRENTPHTSVNFVAPVAEHRYWWRVHSNACGIASHWASPNWFDVGSSGPLAPTLLTPESGESTGLAVTFSWTPAPQAVHHTFQLAAVNDFSSTIVDAESLMVSEYEIEDLVPEQTYYWRVAGFDAEGHYTFSSTRSFSVAGKPSAVALLQPSDGQVGVPAYAVFTWDAAEGADSYHFELSNATDFASVVVDSMVTGTTYEMQAPLAYATEHFWKVCGINLAGEGPCTSRSFTVAIGTAMEPTSEIPEITDLGNPYPNPTSGSVHFPIALAAPGRVVLNVYDVFGRKVATVVDENLGAGRYSPAMNPSQLASGTYVAVLTGATVRSWRLFTVVR